MTQVSSQSNCCICPNLSENAGKSKNTYTKTELLKALLNTKTQKTVSNCKSIPSFFSQQNELENLDLKFTDPKDQQVAKNYNKQQHILKNQHEFVHLYLNSHGTTNVEHLLVGEEIVPSIQDYRNPADFIDAGKLAKFLVYESKVLAYINYLATLKPRDRGKFEILCFVELVQRDPAELALHVEISNKVGRLNHVIYEQSLVAPSIQTIIKSDAVRRAKNEKEGNFNKLLAKQAIPLNLFKNINNLINNKGLINAKLSNPAGPNDYIPVKGGSFRLFRPKPYNLTNINGFWVRNYEEKDRELYNQLLTGIQAPTKSSQKKLILNRLNINRLINISRYEPKPAYRLDLDTKGSITKVPPQQAAEISLNKSSIMVLPKKESLSRDINFTRRVSQSMELNVEVRLSWLKRLWNSFLSYFRLNSSN